LPRLCSSPSHEVVEVLDRGPYKESLPVGGMPLDTGLISKQQTLIELPNWETPEENDVVKAGPESTAEMRRNWQLARIYARLDALAR
jgi:hypothetical protein